MSRNIVISHARNAIIHYNSYNVYCMSIEREAAELLSEHNIEYETVHCSMFHEEGLLITTGLIEGSLLVQYVIPVDVFFNNVKTQEDIKIYAI
jgi:hypothetical protein